MPTTSACGAFQERYVQLTARLRAEQPRSMREFRLLHLAARTPPWTETGIKLDPGDEFTVLAAGHVRWSRDPEIFAGPRYHLWARVGEGEIFRLGSDTRTVTAKERGTLRLCIHHGRWASTAGVLATRPEAYAALDGGIDVAAIRWGDVSGTEGIEKLASLAPGDPLVGAERARLASPPVLPSGFYPLWFVGESDIFHCTEIDGAPAIALLADANAGIVRRPIDLALRSGTFLEWTWRVNKLPSQTPEDGYATHDYASIALEFDDGRDLTWYWSAALPEEHCYRCPVPAWAARETHLVVRSGHEAIGTWLDERRDVYADVARALGCCPSRIVAVWLIGMTLFQRGCASMDFRRIALVYRGRRAHDVFPDRARIPVP